MIQPQADLLGGNLLDLLDISTGPPASSGPAYNAPAGGGGGKEKFMYNVYFVRTLLMCYCTIVGVKFRCEIVDWGMQYGNRTRIVLYSYIYSSLVYLSLCVFSPLGLGDLDLLGDLSGLNLGGGVPVPAAPLAGGGMFGAPAPAPIGGGLVGLGGGLDLFGGIPAAGGSGFYSAPKTVSSKI